MAQTKKGLTIKLKNIKEIWIKINIMKKLIIMMLLVLSIGIYTAAGQPPPPTPSGVPIDGGLLALLIAGVVYAGQKFYRKGKEDGE